MKGYSGALDFDFVIFLTANLNGRYDTLDIFRPGIIRVSVSSTGTASPIQIDGRENCVTEIERLEAAKKGSAAALL